LELATAGHSSNCHCGNVRSMRASGSARGCRLRFHKFAALPARRRTRAGTFAGVCAAVWSQVPFGESFACKAARFAKTHRSHHVARQTNHSGCAAFHRMRPRGREAVGEGFSVNHWALASQRYHVAFGSRAVILEVSILRREYPRKLPDCCGAEVDSSGPRPCENSNARRARRNILEKLRVMRTDNAADIRLDAMLENCIFYISPMYEFSHSLDPNRTWGGGGFAERNLWNVAGS
jgi:hypothetical protein